MSKVKITTGFEDSFPPIGSTGTTVTLPDGSLGFVPDNIEHYPPDEAPEDFLAYVVDASRLTKVEE